MKTKYNITPVTLLLALLVFLFVACCEANGQTIDIHKQPKLRAGEGLQGNVPSWFVLLKVEDGHSGYFGSGTFITERLVLTCHHNIRGVSDDQIKLINGVGSRFDEVEVVLKSPKLDLALLRVPETQKVPRHSVLFVSNDNFKPEGVVGAIGFVPALDSICLYKGTLNGKSYGSQDVSDVSYGHTARVVQGMSGGALVDGSGRIVGVNTSRSGSESLATNLMRLQWFLDQYQGPES